MNFPVYVDAGVVLDPAVDVDNEAAYGERASTSRVRRAGFARQPVYGRSGVRTNRNAIAGAVAVVVGFAILAAILLFAPSDEGAVIGPAFPFVGALVGGLVVGIRGLIQIEATGERGKILALIGVSGLPLYVAFLVALALIGR